MLENTTEVTVDTLLGEVAIRMGQKYRFVTVTCLDGGDYHEIFYHFDRDYQLVNLRLLLTKGNTLPSITGVFAAAVIVENELQDLFGIKVTDLSIDYGGRLLLAEGAPQAPLNKTRAAEAGTKMEVIEKSTPQGAVAPTEEVAK